MYCGVDAPRTPRRMAWSATSETADRFNNTECNLPLPVFYCDPIRISNRSTEIERGLEEAKDVFLRMQICSHLIICASLIRLQSVNDSVAHKMSWWNTASPSAGWIACAVTAPYLASIISQRVLAHAVQPSLENDVLAGCHMADAQVPWLCPSSVQAQRSANGRESPLLTPRS